MPTSNPIPAGAMPRYHEASALRSPRDSDMINRQWRKGQQVARQAEALGHNVHQIQRQLDRLRIRGTGDTPDPVYFPFQILPSPPPDPEQRAALSPPEPVDADLSWRTFRVRSGSVFQTQVWGTDGSWENPDDSEINPNPDFDPEIDFVVPDATHVYYVYIDGTQPSVTGYMIDYGTEEKDWTSGSYFLIAVIDTNSHRSEQKAIVRQYLRTDVMQAGGGIYPVWL